MTGAALRAATVGDAAAIAQIHNQGIEEREATFETRPRSAEEYLSVLGSADERPFLVAEQTGEGDAPEVVGWARVLGYSDRDCYCGVGEASIYIARAARGRGTGRQLLTGLEEAARERGFWKLIGLLFPTNRPSVELFARSGYREVGVFERHGSLEGEWRDVVLVERLLDQPR